MERKTLEQLEAALEAVRKELAPRIAELSEKGTNGVLTPEESDEYAKAVRLNDTLVRLKLEADELWPKAPPPEAT